MHLSLFHEQIREGELTFIDADGSRHRFGEGEPKATWMIRSPRTMGRILRNPALNLGETYLDQGWDVADGKLAELITILRSNLERTVLRRSPLSVAAGLLQSWNHARASLSNVSHHYDLDEALFRTFLDRNMHYSCAYHRDRDMSLESAQLAKCNHVAHKLLLAPGHRVLDIGSGWGSLALHLAEQNSVSVTGLTLSVEQLKVATAEAERRGLAGQVEFRLEDYRDHHGRYDRIVSVGMFEHVGRRYFGAYFERLKNLLHPGGIAVLHTIGANGRPGKTNPWIRRHVFPGGYIPGLSQIVSAVDRAGLGITDVEVLRRHYGLTLKEWNRRFQQRRAELVASRGERFCRLWEFYLVVCQTAFELGRLNVLQLQLVHGASAPIPLTRDYLYTSDDPAPGASPGSSLYSGSRTRSSGT